MPVQRRGDTNLYTVMDAGKAVDDSRKVPLQVQTEGKEVRHHQNPLGSPFDHTRHRFFKIGMDRREKAHFHQFEFPAAGRFLGNGLNRFVRRGDSGSVGKDDDAGSHAAP